jgi:hypothetical protein
MTKPGLTPREHAELGRVLADIHRELVRREIQVANAYPRTSPQVRRLEAATEALGSARAALDSALAREHPDQFQTDTYYPFSDDRR